VGGTANVTCRAVTAETLGNIGDMCFQAVTFGFHNPTGAAGGGGVSTPSTVACDTHMATTAVNVITGSSSFYVTVNNVSSATVDCTAMVDFTVN
jgi:hypothetical protein